MTSEESKVLEAAELHARIRSPWTLGELINSVMDLPMTQWPENACASKNKVRSASILYQSLARPQISWES